MIYVFIASGFEEVEALATVDVLRRAELETKMVGVNGLEITGGHGISVKVDCSIDDISSLEDAQVLVLPGGVPGIHNLKASEKLESLIRKQFERDAYVAAICAAPSVLYDWGLIDQRRITAYPSYLAKLDRCFKVPEDIVVDGKLITGKGVGVALEFGLKIVSELKGEAFANELGQKMVMPNK